MSSIIRIVKQVHILTENNIVIIVATHKKYRMPEDSMYLPLLVGAEGRTDADGRPVDFGYQKDNTGSNISSRNSTYSELTGLYWAWKNLSADYIGLVHYRRYFSVKKKGKDPFANIMTSEEAQSILRNHSIILPKRRHYIIETLYSHYVHTLNETHLDKTRKIIEERCPDCLASYDRVMHRTWGYMFNMMVMRRDLFSEYCSWLFPILSALEQQVDLTGYSDFDKRLFGRVSELLFDVWIEQRIAEKRISRKEIKEVRLLSMEPVNWWIKGTSFLKAKFFHQKYERSF